MNPRILYIDASDYEDLVRDEATDRLKDREENGLFERVVTFHPWAGQSRALELSPMHLLYELHEHIRFGQALRLIRALHQPSHWGKAFKETLRLIDAEKINLIQAMDPGYAGLLAWTAARKRRIPFCISLPEDTGTEPRLGTPQRRDSRRMADRIEKFVLQRADLILATRQATAEKLIARGIPATSVRVILPGIDLGPFFAEPSRGHSRADLQVSPDDHILSFVGRLSRGNYVYDILKLALILKQTHTNFVVIMAGEGPERAAMERFIKEHTLEDKVRLIGTQPHDQIVALRKDSSIALCLRGGRSLIEACAAGRPVIAYDVAWHSDLVKTGITGVLLPEKNVERLVESVKELLYNPDDADWLGESAKVMVFQKYDLTDTSKLRRLFYQELFARVITPP